MMFGARSRYAKGNDSLVSRGRSRISRLASMTSAIIAVIVLSITVFGSLGTTLAHADDESDSQDTIKNLANGYIVNGDDGKTDLGATFDKANSETNENTFGYVLQRFLFTNYMNRGSKGNNCDVNNGKAGTPIYHNCDIPNMGTEITQDLVSMFTQTGPEGAEVTSAKLDIPQFGLPTNIPGGGAPVNPNDRSVKYTALELFGYNLKYTNYNGEWDHIKVMTSARAMSNFGLMDNIKLGATAIMGGIAGGLHTATTNFLSNVSSGDILGAVGGFFSGLFEGGVSGAANTILDASDQNVFDTYGWYRVGYGQTLYGARELTQAEISANMTKKLYEYINQSQPDDASLPADLVSIKGGLPDPKEAISKCEIKNANGDTVEYGHTDTPPGVSESDCVSQADQAASAHEENNRNDDDKDNDEDKVEPWHKWSKDGNQKLETLEEWRSNNSDKIAIAEKYGMKVDIPTDEANRAATIASVKSQWSTEWAKAADAELKRRQEGLNTDWVNQLLTQSAIKDWMGKPENNFNAPWNRFVCLNADGTDKLDGSGNLVMLYDTSGNHNSACANVRPPVQNGFFGNGYGTSIAKDTRYTALDTSVIGTLIPVDSIATKLANSGLWVAVFATRISNTAMNLSFSPILSTLGIEDMIVTVITALRDSIFFPLLVLMVAIAGVMALWSAGKNKDYGRQAISLILMALTIMSGTFLMEAPDKMIKAIDEVPAAVERTIVGYIFSAGNNTTDQLCTATGTASGASETGLEGEVLPYSASEGTRSLLCENWRTFAFNPWVYGQWGTNFSNLYASGSGATHTLNNTNGDLVGDASVNMGGGITMKNWALYQIGVSSSGTASFVDDSVKSQNNSDFYRIVDAQAGPNNGAGRDGSYFEQWSGNNPTSRLTVGLVGSIVSIVGAITVIIYSFSKIMISFMTVMMLIIMPIMFLIGVLPTQGRMKLKGYIGTILGLMVQRVVLVLLLAVMFRILAGIGTLSTDYLMLSLLSVVICIAFLMYRKEILDLVFSGISSKMGTPIGEQFIRNPKDWAAQNGIRPPSAMSNWMSRQRNGVSSVATGAIGGFITGGLRGAGKGARENWQINQDKLRNQQRRKGFGGLETAFEANRAGKQSAQEELGRDLYASNIKYEIYKKSSAYKQYEEAHKIWEGFDHEKVDGVEYAIDPTTNEYLPEPKKPVVDDVLSMNAKANRRLAAAAKNARMVERRGSKEFQKEYRDEIRGNLASDDKGSEYASDAARYSDDFKKSSSKASENARERDNERQEKLEEKVSKATRYNRRFDDSDLRGSLDDLRTRVDNFNAETKQRKAAEERRAEDEYYASVAADEAFRDEEYAETSEEVLDNAPELDEDFANFKNRQDEPPDDMYEEELPPDEDRR